MLLVLLVDRANLACESVKSKVRRKQEAGY